MRRNGARPYDGHLLIAVTRVRLQVNLSNQLAELARETGLELPAAGATAAGDPQRLRGIPCVGRGISGGIRDTRPEDSIGRLDSIAARLAVIARDIPGTSPGSDPLEALLVAEDAASVLAGSAAHAPTRGEVRDTNSHESARDAEP
jgi:hypothetical protein